ncbi:hypothetical protein NE237_003078 [Protea cynaroides]|uniref:DUF4283 domain-containing protein n=1 Tax=Protea cynaroides TaxID=273540 RepID=A0A9Q0KGD2_9MAGN|nr:hypothetical protein NE237_003078 [Protea cynaroides]
MATSTTGRMPTSHHNVNAREHLEEANSQPIVVADYFEKARSLSLLTTLGLLIVWHCKFLVEVSEYHDQKFLFKFKHELDLQIVLTEGPWTVFGTLILLGRWSESGVYAFNTQEFWLQFHEVPAPLFNLEFSHQQVAFISELSLALKLWGVQRGK